MRARARHSGFALAIAHSSCRQCAFEPLVKTKTRGLRAQRRQSFAIRHELQSNAIVAIAFSGRRRTIIENMSLMPAATTAMIFRAQQQKLEITFGCNRSGKRIEEAGPPRSCVVFRG